MIGNRGVICVLNEIIVILYYCETTHPAHNSKFIWELFTELSEYKIFSAN